MSETVIDNNKVRLTTFYGGVKRGRCYEVTDKEKHLRYEIPEAQVLLLLSTHLVPTPTVWVERSTP